MEFLKNSPRFSFLYDGKPHTDSLLETTQSETTIECNLVVLKVKHTITRKPK